MIHYWNTPIRPTVLSKTAANGWITVSLAPGQPTYSPLEYWADGSTYSPNTKYTWPAGGGSGHTLPKNPAVTFNDVYSIGAGGPGGSGWHWNNNLFCTFTRGANLNLPAQTYNIYGDTQVKGPLYMGPPYVLAATITVPPSTLPPPWPIIHGPYGDYASYFWTIVSPGYALDATLTQYATLSPLAWDSKNNVAVELCTATYSSTEHDTYPANVPVVVAANYTASNGTAFAGTGFNSFNGVRAACVCLSPLYAYGSTPLSGGYISVSDTCQLYASMYPALADVTARIA